MYKVYRADVKAEDPRGTSAQDPSPWHPRDQMSSLVEVLKPFFSLDLHLIEEGLSVF